MRDIKVARKVEPEILQKRREGVKRTRILHLGKRLAKQENEGF